MTESADQARQEVEIRACCGNLRWALLEAVESLPGGAHVGALRWGPAEIPVDVEAGAGPADRAVQSILDAARRRLGSGASCYAGRGALLIDAGRAPPRRRRGNESRGNNNRPSRPGYTVTIDGEKAIS